MIELYSAPTGNGLRAAVALAESGLPYTVKKLDLAKGEQKAADYLKINPAGSIPAIVDDGTPIAQSGAIVLYLAEKTGKFLPKDPAKRAAAYQWFMQASSDVAPTGGVLFALNNSAPEKSPAIIGFFEERLLRFLKVVDGQLAGKDYIVGEISIADLALYPAIAARKPMIEKAGLANVLRWMDTMAARPGVAKGMKLE